MRQIKLSRCSRTYAGSHEYLEATEPGLEPSFPFPRVRGSSLYVLLPLGKLARAEVQGFKLWFSNFAVQHNHPGRILKIKEPSILKDQDHAGRAQRCCLGKMLHFLRLWMEGPFCTADPGALRVCLFLVPLNLHHLLTGQEVQFL